MNSPQITDLSIGALHRLYRSGAATPSEVVASIFDRLEADPLHPVWISLVSRADAVGRAAGLDSSQGLPLFGIPFAVKDNIDAAGYETTAGCPAFAFVPPVSAFAVTRLVEAGAILIGKTNLDQFATGLVGTRSPHGACSSVFDSRYISGGSSSGSAVAVAAGPVTFSLGTDTAGSGRVPAGFNNIVGMKPSRGLISTAGVVPACRSLDCVSIFALSCADAKAVFDVAKGLDSGDPFSRALPPSAALFPQTGLRIGVPRRDQRQFFGNTGYQRLYEDTLTTVAVEHSLCEIDFEPFRAAAELLYAGPYVAERFAAVGEFVKSHSDAVDPIVRSIILGSERWTASDAYKALYTLHAVKKRTEEIWKSVDLLLLPTAPSIYTIEEIENDPIALNSRLGYYTNFVNLLDLCGVAVPAGFTRDGLPFGVTVIGQAFQDAALLSFAHTIQEQRSPIAGRMLSPIPGNSALSAPPAYGWIELGVIGAHLSGQPLNHQLTSRGARLLSTQRTAPDYRMYALTNTNPLKPGLIRNPGFDGPGIEIEIWAIHESQFGSFVAAVPPPLSIGTCRLSSGALVKGFLCEPYATEGMPEITSLGGWRAFLATKPAV